MSRIFLLILWTISFQNIYFSISLDVNELDTEKFVAIGEPFEIVFTTNQPGGFMSCDAYRPGEEKDSMYLQVIGNKNNVTR